MKSKINARPHPQERENRSPVAGEFWRAHILERPLPRSNEVGTAQRSFKFCRSGEDFSLSRGARARVRASVTTILLLILLVVFPSRTSAQNTGDISAAFDAANKLYAQGKFAEAASAYENLALSGTVSPVLYFNLGNAFFKSSQMGRAIAAYRQAEQLTPRDPDVRANLQFARNQVQGPTLRPGRWERWLGTLNLNEWTGLSAAALWLTFGLLTLRQVRPAVARSLRSWTLLTGGCSAILLACLALAWTGQAHRQTAIVTVKEATVRNGPFDESPNAFTAQDGAELRVLDRKDDWLQVTDGTRRIGWVKRDAVLVSASS